MAGEVPPVETDVPPVETDGAVPPVVAVTLTQGEEISDGITTLAALQETQQTVPQTIADPANLGPVPRKRKVAEVSTETPPPSPRKKPPETPSPKAIRKRRPPGSPKKLPWEPVLPEHRIRKFSYTPRCTTKTPLAFPPPPKDAPDPASDPWDDFEQFAAGTTVSPGINVSLTSDQWACMAGDPKAWFEGDQIAYYTCWSQRETPHYDQAAGGGYFPLSFPSSQQASLYNWFVSRRGESEKAEDVSKLISYIWRLVHPPSYIFFLESMDNPEYDHWYKKNASILGSVPMDFNVLSKRVMTAAIGSGSHWVTYVGLHVGECLCKTETDTRSGKHHRPKPMIIVADSISEHEFGSSEDLFVVFLFDVILHLEKYITILTNLKAGASVPSPELAKLGNASRERAIGKASIFGEQLFQSHKKFYKQNNDDSFNCGIYACINVTSVYLADRYSSVDWVELRDAHAFFMQVMQPYWRIQRGGKQQVREKWNRCQLFRTNMISMCQSAYPSTWYKAVLGGVKGDQYHLVELRNGKKVLNKDLKSFLTRLRRSDREEAEDEVSVIEGEGKQHTALEEIEEEVAILNEIAPVDKEELAKPDEPTLAEEEEQVTIPDESDPVDEEEEVDKPDETSLAEKEKSDTSEEDTSLAEKEKSDTSEEDTKSKAATSGEDTTSDESSSKNAKAKKRRQKDMAKRKTRLTNPEDTKQDSENSSATSSEDESDQKPMGRRKATPKGSQSTWQQEVATTKETKQRQKEMLEARIKKTHKS